ncbi:MAG: septum formation initiator family protein [Cyclobacteriaceae bacterium]|nr:septum formation initiator family protein [Cyclobacteriaceae bacterium]
MKFTLPAFTKNFYFIAGCAFAFWMLFIDANDIITQIKTKSKLNTLRKEKVFFEEKIKEAEIEKEQLFTNEDMLEKFAREKYFMRKDKEDLYVIVED